MQSVLDFFAPANQTEDIKPQQHQNRTKSCQPVKSWKHLNHTRKPYCVIPPKPYFNHTKPHFNHTKLHFNHTKPHFNHTRPHFNHTHRYNRPIPFWKIKNKNRTIQGRGGVRIVSRRNHTKPVKPLVPKRSRNMTNNNKFNKTKEQLFKIVDGDADF